MVDPLIIKKLIEVISGKAYREGDDFPIEWHLPLVKGHTPISLVSNITGLGPQEILDAIHVANVPPQLKVAHRLLNAVAGTQTQYPEAHLSWWQPVGMGLSPWMLVANVTGLSIAELQDKFPVPITVKPPERLPTQDFGIVEVPRPDLTITKVSIYQTLLNSEEFLTELAQASRINTTTIKPILEAVGYDLKIGRRRDLILLLADQGFLKRTGGKRGVGVYYVPTQKLLNFTRAPEPETVEAPKPAVAPLKAKEASRAPSTEFVEHIGRYTVHVSPRILTHIYRDLRFATKVTGEPLAGSFQEWAGIGEIFRDPEFISKLEHHITEARGGREKWANFEIHYSKPVGWADTVPLEWIPDDMSFHPKRLTNKKTGQVTTLQVIDDHTIPGPVTSVITVGIDFGSKKGNRHINITRLYPGPFVGAFAAEPEAGRGMYIFLSKDEPYPPGDIYGFWDNIQAKKLAEETARIRKETEEQQQLNQLIAQEQLEDLKTLVLLALSDESDPVSLGQLAENAGITEEEVSHALNLLGDDVAEVAGNYVLSSKYMPPSPSPAVVMEPEPEPVAEELTPIGKLSIATTQPFEYRGNGDAYTLLNVKTDSGNVPLALVIPEPLQTSIRKNRCGQANCGNFLVYKDIVEALSRDAFLWNVVSNRLEAILRKQIRSSSGTELEHGIELDFTVHHQNIIGWADHIPSYFVRKWPDADVSERVHWIDRIFTGRDPSRRPKILSDVVHNLPAPVTNQITFHVWFGMSRQEEGYVMHVRDVYPGSSMGDLTQPPFNLDQRGITLFNLTAPGEEINNRTTSQFIKDQTTALQQKLKEEWLTKLASVKAENYAAQIGMPFKYFADEILRPMGFTTTHKEIIAGKARASQPPKKKRKKSQGPTTARKILFIGGTLEATGLRVLKPVKDWLQRTYYYDEVEGGGGLPMGNLPNRTDYDLIIIFTRFMGHSMDAKIKSKYEKHGIPIVHTGGKGAFIAAVRASEKAAPWFYAQAIRDGILDDPNIAAAEKETEETERRNPLRGAELCKLIEQNVDYLSEEYNIVFDDCLGAGRHGCVYQYGKDLVVKFSLSTREAKFAAYLAANDKRLWGFPGIKYVDRIQIPGFKPSVYVIVKEDVPSVELPPLAIDLLARLCEIANPKKPTEVISDQLYSYLDKAFEAIFEENLSSELNEHIELLLYNFADFLVTCAENYIFITDISRRNLGIRSTFQGENLVIRDFSYCEIVS